MKLVKRVPLVALLVTTMLILVACQDPEQNRLVRPAPGEWDASVWNTALWE